MKKLYHFFLNPFMPSGKRNYKKMLTLSSDHNSALFSSSNETLIQSLYTRTEPVLTKYKDVYVKYLNVQGQSKGNVIGFNLYKKEIPTKLRKWERDIIGVVGENSKFLRECFPQGKRKLYKTTNSKILINLKLIESILKDIPELSLVYQEVSEYNTILQEASEFKGMTLHEKNSIRNEIKQIHDEMALMLYRNLLALTEHYAPNTKNVEHFFKLYLLRQHKHKKEETKENKPETKN